MDRSASKPNTPNEGSVGLRLAHQRLSAMLMGGEPLELLARSSGREFLVKALQLAENPVPLNRIDRPWAPELV